MSRMASYLPFVHASFAPRAKRKMSGPAVTIAASLDKEMTSLPSIAMHLPTQRRSGSATSLSTLSSASASTSSTVSSSAVASSTSTTTSSAMCRMQQTWCDLCRRIDVREVLAFMMWEALTVGIVVLAVADWIFFFKYVVEPESYRTRMQYGGVWAVCTVLLLWFRQFVRSKCGDAVRSLADHAEIFVTVSMIMVFGTNIAFYLHTPSATPLRDLGFMLIPEQAIDSKWRPVSDILTAVVPVLFMVQSYFMTRENRCRVMSSFFRVATICYGLRMCTIALTSLPGPAPHCRPGSLDYHPPKNWIDIVTRVGPMYGNYNSCGDLIFSGHMAYTNSALLLYLRVLDRYHKRHSRLRWCLGMLYLCVLATLCIAGRKHYTVDVVLGIIMSTLVFFHFEHGWIPPCWHQDQLVAWRHQHLALPRKQVSIEFTDEDDYFHDDVEDDEDPYDDAEAWLVSNRKAAKPTPIEFIC